MTSHRITRVLTRLGKELKKDDIRQPIPFRTFLERLQERPQRILRNVFQLFHDLVHHNVPEGMDEYPNDPESINYIRYNTSRLLAEGVTSPYYADRLFANRLINHANALRRGVQQNVIYLFEGPAGAGKSTFLNNLLQKFEEYSQQDEGECYETVWRLDVDRLGGFPKIAVATSAEGDLTEMTESVVRPESFADKFLTVPCPSHDHPILQIPRAYRESFLAELLDDDMQRAVREEPQYAWVLEGEPCTICQALYQALLEKLGSPGEVFNLIHPRRNVFSRRLGEGISVYNPGDQVVKRPITNPVLQGLLNQLFRDSNSVRYVYSRMAKTNNGVFAIMDVKGHNKDRVLNLHGIISDKVHKVEYLEEYITSLFLCLINPEDERVFDELPSFQDRIVRIRMPYILDYVTEATIYREKIGGAIGKTLLPGVLESFAKVIIATRLRPRSEAITAWISRPPAYRAFCDDNLLLLKMDIYTGLIPHWLTEEDQQRFDARTRRAVIAEGEFEGVGGCSGRHSVQLFNQFFAQFSQARKLVTLDQVIGFFRKQKDELRTLIPEGFLEALAHHYEFTLLQQVEDALYDYNREQIDRNLKNYLSALNFELGTSHRGIYTGEPLEVTEGFFEAIERHLVGTDASLEKRTAFRADVHRDYVAKALSQEILTEGKSIDQTRLYLSLYNRYASALRRNVLRPFVGNQTFRMAVKDYGSKAFISYDERTRADAEFLLRNLEAHHGYTTEGAQYAVLTVLDQKLHDRFRG